MKSGPKVHGGKKSMEEFDCDAKTHWNGSVAFTLSSERLLIFLFQLLC